MSGKRKPVTYIEDENGCHICTSHALDADGYPCVTKNDKKHHLHRVLFEESTSTSLDNLMVVRHTCDNRACINTLHLLRGTRKQNSEDMVARNRCNTLRGESRSDTKLLDKDVLFIRSSNLSQYKLASMFNVNQSTISRIKSGIKRQYVIER